MPIHPILQQALAPFSPAEPALVPSSYDEALADLADSIVMALNARALLALKLEPPGEAIEELNKAVYHLRLAEKALGT